MPTPAGGQRHAVGDGQPWGIGHVEKQDLSRSTVSRSRNCEPFADFCLSYARGQSGADRPHPAEVTMQIGVARAARHPGESVLHPQPGLREGIASRGLTAAQILAMTVKASARAQPFAIIARGARVHAALCFLRR